MPAQYESIDKTLERRRRMQQSYPTLSTSSPRTNLEVDARISAAGRPPSSLSRDMVRTANDTYDVREQRARPYPTPIDRAVDYVGRSGRPGDGAPREGRGLGDVLGDFGGFLTDSAKRVPSDILNTVSQLDRPRGAFFGSIAGVEDAPVYQAPFAAIQGAVEGFRDPQGFQGRDSSLAEGIDDTDRYPFSLSNRDVVGGLLDVVFDPIDLLTGGTVGTDLVRGGSRLVKNQLDNMAVDSIGRDIAKLPKPQEGTVRLFRAEPADGSIRVPEAAEVFTNNGEAVGRWFTDDLDSLEFYINNIGARRVNVRSVDVPVDEANRFRVSTLEQQIGGEFPREFSGRGDIEYFLPRTIADSGLSTDRATQAAVRAAEGPLDASTRGALRPAKGTPGRMLESVEIRASEKAADARWAEELQRVAPLEEGKVRLYRGESNVDTGYRSDRPGQWYTDSEHYAREYARNSAGPFGQIYFVDVPASQVEDMRAFKHSAESGQYNEFIVPEELLETRRRLPSRYGEEFWPTDRIRPRPATPGAIDPVIPGVTPRGRANVRGSTFDDMEDLRDVSKVRSRAEEMAAARDSYAQRTGRTSRTLQAELDEARKEVEAARDAYMRTPSSDAPPASVTDRLASARARERDLEARMADEVASVDPDVRAQVQRLRGMRADIERRLQDAPDGAGKNDLYRQRNEIDEALRNVSQRGSGAFSDTEARQYEGALSGIAERLNVIDDVAERARLQGKQPLGMDMHQGMIDRNREALGRISGVHSPNDEAELLAGIQQRVQQRLDEYRDRIQQGFSISSRINEFGASSPQGRAAQEEARRLWDLLADDDPMAEIPVFLGIDQSGITQSERLLQVIADRRQELSSRLTPRSQISPRPQSTPRTPSPGAVDPVIPGVTPRGRANVQGGSISSPTPTRGAIREADDVIATTQSAAARRYAEAQKAADEPVYGAIVDAYEQAAAAVRTDPQGAVSRLAGNVPGLRNIRDWDRPGLTMERNILEGHIAKRGVESQLLSSQGVNRTDALRTVDDAFGEGASGGTRILDDARVNVDELHTFNGREYPGSGTAFDALQRPYAYNLTPEQTQALRAWSDADEVLRVRLNDKFGGEVGKFVPERGGVYVQNINKSEARQWQLETLARNEARTISAGGTSKTRVYETGFDRWKNNVERASKGILKDEQVFVPETDLRVLGYTSDLSKANAAGDLTFRAAVGGKTISEVKEEIAPSLVRQRQQLRTDIDSLRGRIQRAEQSLRRDNTLASRFESFLNRTSRRAQQIDDRIVRMQEKTAGLPSVADARENLNDAMRLLNASVAELRSSARESGRLGERATRAGQVARGVGQSAANESTRLFDEADRLASEAQKAIDDLAAMSDIGATESFDISMPEFARKSIPSVEELAQRLTRVRSQLASASPEQAKSLTRQLGELEALSDIRRAADSAGDDYGRMLGLIEEQAEHASQYTVDLPTRAQMRGFGGPRAPTFGSPERAAYDADRMAAGRGGFGANRNRNMGGIRRGEKPFDGPDEAIAIYEDVLTRSLSQGDISISRARSGVEVADPTALTRNPRNVQRAQDVAERALATARRVEDRVMATAERAAGRADDVAGRADIARDIEAGVAGDVSDATRGVREAQRNLTSATRSSERATGDIDAMESVIAELDRTATALDRTVRSASGRADLTRQGIESLRDDLLEVQDLYRDVKRAYDAVDPQDYAQISSIPGRYFPTKEAAQLEELTRPAKQNLLTRRLEDWRSQVLAGDIGPLTGIQGLILAASGRAGVSKAVAGSLAQAAKSGDLFNAYRTDAMTEFLRQNAELVDEFAFYTGRNVGGRLPAEIGQGGLLPYIRPVKWTRKVLGQADTGTSGFTTANEAMFNVVTRRQIEMFRRIRDDLVKAGYSPEEAGAAAGDLSSKVVPLMTTSRLGQSAGKAQEQRFLPTSIGFIRQPLALTEEAFTGLGKMATGQSLTPRQKLATSIYTQFIGNLLTIGVSSAAINALASGDDVEGAIADALDPASRAFIALSIGDERVPLATPFRAPLRVGINTMRNVLNIVVEPLTGKDISADAGDSIVNYATGRIGPPGRSILEAGNELTAAPWNRQYQGDNDMLRLLSAGSMLASGTAPIPAQGIAEEAKGQYDEGEFKPLDLLATAAAETASFSLIPQEDRKALDSKAQQAFGSPFSELDRQQRRFLLMANPDLTDVAKDDVRTRMEESGFEQATEQAWKEMAPEFGIDAPDYKTYRDNLRAEREAEGLGRTDVDKALREDPLSQAYNNLRRGFEFEWIAENADGLSVDAYDFGFIPDNEDIRRMLGVARPEPQ